VGCRSDCEDPIATTAGQPIAPARPPTPDGSAPATGATGSSAPGHDAAPGTSRATPKPRLPSPKPLRRLVPLLRPYTGRLAIAFVCLVAAAAAALIFPTVVRYLLDAVFQQHSRSLLNRLALGLVGLFAAQGMMNFAQVYILTSTAERVIARLREDLFGHLIRLSPAYFTERRTGELTSRLSADLAILQSLCNTWISEFSRQVILLVGGVTLLMLTHTRLAVTTLAVSPVVVAAAFIFGRALRRASTGVQDRVAEAMGTADEAFSQVRIVQGFVREDGETRRFANHLHDVVTAAIHRALLRGLFFGVVGFVAFAGVDVILWQGGLLVLQHGLTEGGFLQFLLYAFIVAAAVGSLASLFGSYQEAVGAAHRVFEMLSTVSAVAEPADPEPLRRPARGAIAFENVTFRYGDELPDVLRGVSLTIAPGEVVALVGPSGAGKTTIASLLPRFWDVTAGLVSLDGRDVRTLSFADLRGAIGIVPQEPALFSGTVRENIAYARPEALEADVAAAARAAHATEFIDRLPNGFETRVGERGVKLSGGQRQRLAIARVFLKDPAVVVLDEATSSLDSESERLVEQAMEDLLRGRSTLIIAHRLSTVLRADRIVVLEGGRVVEEGTHTTLLALDGVYARLYRGQFRAGEDK